MALKLGEIRRIEELSASDEPSAQGAWWIMLQTAESICNCASMRDPVNNAYLMEFWSEAAPRVEEFIGIPGDRPLPYDDLMQMVSFCGNQLQEVVKDPKHNLVKVDRMVRPEKARDIGYKTISWLSKQPGKTVREKMAGKQSLLTQKKEYSFDIKENQVAMALYKQIMRRVADRFNNAIKMQAYDNTDNFEMNQMAKIKKLLRKSPLKDVIVKNHTQANNVLLSDKNYSVLWRAYLDMSRYDTRLEKKWEHALELYVKAVYLAINAKLLSYDDIYVIEDRVKFDGLKSLSTSYIIGYHYRIPYIANLSLVGKSILVKMYDAPLDGGFKSDFVKEVRITFSDAVSKDKLAAKKGTPLIVEYKEDGKLKKMYCFADLSCIRDLLKMLMETVFKFTEIEAIERTENETVSKGVSVSAAFDIVGNGTYLGILNGEISILDRFYSDRGVIYEKNNAEIVYPCGLKSVHLEAKGDVGVSDAVLSDENRGLRVVLDEIHEKVSLRQDDYFFYLVPDALEELRQKNLKQCVKGCFTRTFPVWRSVAALSSWINELDYEFSEDDVFVYMDLVGETATAGMMTIHYESELDSFTCNHFPPFPQVEEGDSITEDAFCEAYVREYSRKYNFPIPDDAVKCLVKDNSIRDLMLGSSYANYFYKDNNKICLYQITYDEDLVNKCISKWLDNIYIFWNKTRRRLGQNKESYVYFLSDLLIQFVSEEDLQTLFTESEWVNIKGVFQSSSQRMLEGALLFKERLANHLPIWTEFLPKLSLKIPIQGKYEDWDLIGDDMAIDVMEDDNEFPIKEQKPLRLHAGSEEYCFELKKEDISRRPSRIEAVIPINGKLKEDVDVNLFIRYKYGYDNSYELILRPVDTVNSPFEEMIAEWRSGYREKRNVGGPKFPPLRSSKEVGRDVEFIKTNLEKTVKPMSYYLGYRYDFSKVSEKFKFDLTCKYLTINTFKLREILRYYEINEDVQGLVEWFFDSQLYMYCRELMLLKDFNYLSQEFVSDYNGKEELERLRSCATQLIYSFGVFVPHELQQYIEVGYHDMNFDFKQSILLNSIYKNTDNDGIWSLVLELFQKRSNSIIINSRSLSNLCWCDENMIPKLGMYPALVSEIVKTSISEIKSMRRMTAEDDKFKVAQKRYLSLIEIILAILRLRENEDFNLLVAGTKEAFELADLIREVDDIMGNPESRIKLAVEKPDALRNMSNIAYAIDMYLTGNEGVNSIEVLSVESDE
jgi:hypothetical protein